MVFYLTKRSTLPEIKDFVRFNGRSGSIFVNRQLLLTCYNEQICLKAWLERLNVSLNTTVELPVKTYLPICSLRKLFQTSKSLTEAERQF